jgi:hypothetical protein
VSDLRNRQQQIEFLKKKQRNSAYRSQQPMLEAINQEFLGRGNVAKTPVGRTLVSSDVILRGDGIMANLAKGTIDAFSMVTKI